MGITVAVSMRVTSAVGYYEPRMSVSFDWIDYMQYLDIIPVLIPCKPALAESYLDNSNVTALLLTGGDDIKITDMSMLSSADVEDVSLVRDIAEYRLIELAIARNIPIVGVCRGFQLLNLFFGGSLLKQKENIKEQHVGEGHKINIVDTKMRHILHCNETVVNTYHRQTVEDVCLASSLIPFAITEGNIVEGFYHKTLPVAGVQWHPEREKEYKAESVAFMELYLKYGGL